LCLLLLGLNSLKVNAFYATSDAAQVDEGISAIGSCAAYATLQFQLC